MAWSAIALVEACEQARTELVVTVDSEVAWGPGRGVQSVVIAVRRGGATGPLRSMRATALGPGRQQLPMSVGVIGALDDTATPVWIEVLGCGDPNGCTPESAAVTQRAVVRFVSGQTLELPLLLASACAGVTCASDQRCVTGSGQCEAATRAQETLRPFTGAMNARDAAAAVEDARKDVEAAMDSSFDAATADLGATDVPGDTSAAIDAATQEAGPADVGHVDVGAVDAGPADAGPREVGVVDVGLADVGPTDASGPTITCPLPSGTTTCTGSRACCFTFAGLPSGCGCAQTGGLICLPCN
jgi:hypothetical protein